MGKNKFKDAAWRPKEERAAERAAKQVEERAEAAASAERQAQARAALQAQRARAAGRANAAGGVHSSASEDAGKGGKGKQKGKGGKGKGGDGGDEFAGFEVPAVKLGERARRPHALAPALRLYYEGKEPPPEAQVARLLKKKAQPSRRQYGGMGLARPSDLLLPWQADFADRIQEAFNLRVEGFSSGKGSFKGLTRKQEQAGMLWKRALDAKRAAQDAEQAAGAQGGAGGKKRKGARVETAPSSTLAAFLAEEEAARRKSQPQRRKKKSKWRSA